MRKRIGDFLIEKGVISEHECKEIVAHGGKTGLRFGEAGLDLGVLTPQKLAGVLGPNYLVDFFHIEPIYFPRITRDILPTSEMLRYGALPLGFKTEYRFFRARKMLNLGLVDPSRQDAVPALRELVSRHPDGKDIAGVKVFLILADQFLAVMNDVYGLSDEKILLGGAEIDPALSVLCERG